MLKDRRIKAKIYHLKAIQKIISNKRNQRQYLITIISKNSRVFQRDVAKSIKNLK